VLAAEAEICPNSPEKVETIVSSLFSLLLLFLLHFFYFVTKGDLNVQENVLSMVTSLYFIF
jgi:hypothetical protein